jgi:hypothetical protein
MSENDEQPKVYFSERQNPLSWTEEYEDPDVMAFAE